MKNAFVFHLTLIDSTHKTNRYDWRLFTLYIRDGFGCWDVGAHFFVSGEDGDSVGMALKIVRQFERRWIPRYILADQSSVEANSIQLAFPGLSAGEQECDVILCTVHVMRTWMKKIYHLKTRERMILAMHKRTKAGCEQIIQQAINSCPVQAVQQYILRNYRSNTHRWALWARQHSPLLLQVTTTNPLESYHSELKRITSSSFGLIGACHKVVEVDIKKRSDSEIAALNFRTKKLSVADVDDEILGEIHKFPFPMQRLIIDQLCAVTKRLENGKAAPGLTSLECYCQFHHRYLLPCKHIFHEHIYGETRLLTPDVWNSFQKMFEESGFEVYVSRAVIEVQEIEQTEAEREAECRRLMVNELMERTRDLYWRWKKEGM